MNDQNVYLDRVFEHIGRSSRPEPVSKMTLGIYARECDRVVAELGVAPPPSHNADRGLRLTRELTRRAANLARGIDNDPRRHIEIAADFLTENEIREHLEKIFGGRR